MSWPLDTAMKIKRLFWLCENIQPAKEETNGLVRHLRIVQKTFYLLVQSSSKQYKKWRTTMTKACKEMSAMYIWNAKKYSGLHDLNTAAYKFQPSSTDSL